jgi:hypothetical protein
LIITNQPDTPTSSDGELHGGVEGEGVGHAGFIDDQQRRWADRGRPIGQVAVPQRPGEFGESVGADAGLLAKNSGCRRGRGEADHLAAVLGPGESEGTHGGGLPGASRGDRQLQPGTEVHICRTSAACPASRAVLFAAISSSARSTAGSSTTGPSRRPAAMTRRCSASRIRYDVYRSAPATV